MCRKSVCLLLLYASFCVAVGTAKAEDVWGEAEAASSITAPLQVLADDPNASGGEYIAVEAGNNSSGGAPATGVATYSVSVADGGVYRMYLRVRCTETGDVDDSCYVRIVGAALNIDVLDGGWVNTNNIDYGIEDSTAWFWKQVGHYAAFPGNDPVEFTLDPGTYTVEIAYREDGLLIDGFLISNVPDIDAAALPDVIPNLAPLKVDFSSMTSPIEEGFEVYAASHEVADTFTTQTYDALGGTISITPTWAEGAVPAVMQLIDRGNGTTDGLVNLLRDWIGSDTRSAGDPLTLTISGLPAGTYSWLSYHHDRDALTMGKFDVTVIDARGQTTTTGVQITGNAVTAVADVAKFETTIVSGGADVALVFDQEPFSNPYNAAWFVLNGFELELVSAGLDTAFSPNPYEGQTGVLRDAVLSWKASGTAVAHDVYFGTDLDAVDMADVNSPLLVGSAQAETSYAPAGLQYGQTYYWRVDEIEESGTVWKGSVWSFTVDSYVYPLAPVGATATTVSTEDNLPVKAIDGSGLIDGAHDTVAENMWVGEAVDGVVPAIEFDLDGVYKLQDMQVWNYNAEIDVMLGFGLKDVTVEYAVDPNEWMTLGDFEIARASLSPDYTGVTLDLQGIVAQYVKLTIKSNWGGNQTFGLSEVRFSYVPVLASQPDPADGASGVAPNVVLSWRSGREAASHQVNLGTDSDAVAAGQALVDTTDVAAYDTASLGLLLGQEYFWMITEVNDAETPAAWDGAVWSFQTPESIVIDDMESYDDKANLVYLSWVDGLTNGTGSQVDGPELNVFHGGKQSLPVQFGLNGLTTSEVTLTLAEPLDMTLGGAQTLVIWFRGNLGNGTPQLYAKINDTLVDYTGSAGSLAASVWTQWNIDLASLEDASLISLTLGVSGEGAGTLCFDDISLYRDAAPATGEAIDPGTDNLVAYYPMSGDVNDASGNAYDGIAEAGASFGDGPAGLGQALVLDGSDAGYVNLGIGSLVESLGSSTYAVWVNWAGSGSMWCRIFDIGTSTSNYMFLTPYASGDSLRFAITKGSGESMVSHAGILPAGWHHVAVTIDEATMGMALYLDGEKVATGTTSTLPRELGNTNLNYLGKSQWPDPLLPGSLDDFRIYDRTLSVGEIQFLAGGR